MTTWRDFVEAMLIDLEAGRLSIPKDCSAEACQLWFDTMRECKEQKLETFEMLQVLAGSAKLTIRESQFAAAVVCSSSLFFKENPDCDPKDSFSKMEEIFLEKLRQ